MSDWQWVTVASDDRKWLEVGLSGKNKIDIELHQPWHEGHEEYEDIQLNKLQAENLITVLKEFISKCN